MSLCTRASAKASLVLIVAAGVAAFAKETPEERQTINVRDIPNRVQILGTLGRPLGEIVRVRAEWVNPDPSKPSDPQFSVTAVNGIAWQPPVFFSASDVEPVMQEHRSMDASVGTVWECTGVETGGFVGFSDDVWRALRVQKPAMPVGFRTRFAYISAERQIEK